MGAGTVSVCSEVRSFMASSGKLRLFVVLSQFQIPFSQNCEVLGQGFSDLFFVVGRTVNARLRPTHLVSAVILTRPGDLSLRRLSSSYVISHRPSRQEKRNVVARAPPTVGGVRDGLSFTTRPLRPSPRTRRRPAVRDRARAPVRSYRQWDAAARSCDVHH